MASPETQCFLQNWAKPVSLSDLLALLNVHTLQENVLNSCQIVQTINLRRQSDRKVQLHCQTVGHSLSSSWTLWGVHCAKPLYVTQIHRVFPDLPFLTYGGRAPDVVSRCLDECTMEVYRSSFMPAIFFLIFFFFWGVVDIFVSCYLFLLI